jgi:hypothetical protein
MMQSQTLCNFGISTAVSKQVYLQLVSEELQQMIWLNYTYRGSNFVNAKIYARSNQIVPAGWIQVIAATNIGGSYNANQNINNYFE